MSGTRLSRIGLTCKEPLMANSSSIVGRGVGLSVGKGHYESERLVAAFIGTASMIIPYKDDAMWLSAKYWLQEVRNVLAKCM